MLLAIDIGNTNSVFAVVENGKIREQFRMRTDARRTADEYFVWFSTLCEARKIPLNVENVILSSTVPAAVFNIRVLAHRYFSGEPVVVGTENCKLDLPIRVDAGTGVGSDRLVNAIAGFANYGADLIVVDFGTATTFDIVGHDGGYEGGVIATGVNLSLKALSDAAAALPHIEVAQPQKIIGTNTKGAMQSGIYWGYISLIEGMCARIMQEYGRPMKVILTGGLASLFAKGTTKFDALDGDLTIKGLILISERNGNLL